METKEHKKTKRKPKLLPSKNLRFINPKQRANAKHEIARIELTEAYTRIDFNYTAPDYYVNGGWIQIDPDTYIRPTGSSMRYTIQKVAGIHFAPQKTYFKRCGQKHTYTLYFPALPPDTLSIDIIEKEAPGTYFNFYNIRFSSWLKLNIPKSTFINS